MLAWTCFSSASASAAAPPRATSGRATALTASSATLLGSVYPGDQETYCYFEYGPTASYGASTPTVAAGTGKETLHLSTPVSGLMTDTTYHYRLVASNASGVSIGADRTFATKAVPLSFEVLAPTHALYREPFVVTGDLSGTGSAGRLIALQADEFPYSLGFDSIGFPTTTAPTGSFAFSVPGLDRNAKLRVVTVGQPAKSSAAFAVSVRVNVTLHIHATTRAGYVRFAGSAAPAQPAVALVQRLRPGDRPVTLARLRLGRGGTFSRILKVVRRGYYRVYVRVEHEDQTSSASRAVLVR